MLFKKKMQEVLSSLCNTYPDMSDSLRDVIARLDKWSDFLTQRVPGDIWLKIFIDSVTNQSLSISFLARVCETWNHVVRKHARRLIHVYLNKVWCFNEKCVCGCKKTLTILIDVQSVESLKKYNKNPGGESLWGFHVDRNRNMLRSGKPEQSDEAIEYTEISAGQGWSSGFAFKNPNKENSYLMLARYVKCATMLNGDVYSGEVNTILVPKNYEMDIRDGDIIIKRQKVLL